MAWLDEVLDSTSEAESPRSFILWSAMAALSAVVQRNVWLDKFMYKLYPNIYVMLIAKSGMRKGFPIYVAKELVKQVNNTRIIAGRNSIQAVISELAKGYSPEGGGPPLVDAAGFLVSGELATFLIEDPGAVTILTDLYDTHYNSEWRNTLKSGKETLKNVCLTMLTASNQTLFREAIPVSAFSGGFLARTLLIHEEKRSKKNPLTTAPQRTFDAKEHGGYLKEVAKLKGPFSWEPAAKQVFEEWYDKFEPETKDDKTGTADRLHDQIMKVAMLISLSKRLDLTLKEQDVEDAIRTCMSFTFNVEKLTSGTGKAQLANQMQMVLNELLKQPDYQISRVKLLQKYYGEFDANDLDRIIDTFCQGKILTISPTPKGPVYRLEPEVIEHYQKIQKLQQS